MSLFGKEESIRMIGSIRAMRLDNIVVDGRTLPSGWLSENGLHVRVVRELSSFKEDGSIARAGESYHNAIYFTSDYGLDEKRIFRLPGSSMRHNPDHWSQEIVDAEVYSLLNKNQRLIEEKQRLDQKRAEAQLAQDERMRQRDSLIELFFSQHGQKAVTYRKNQIVATCDGLIWQVSSKIHDDVELSSYGDDGKRTRVVSNEAILIPANDKIMREFRSMLHGIST